MADEPQQNLITTVALLSSQMGALQHAVEGTLKDHGKRLTAVEEWQIRADERDKAEDRLRRALQDERQQQADEIGRRVTVRLSTWQLWFAAIGALAMVAAVVVSLAQTL